MILPKPEDSYRQEIEAAKQRGWNVNLDNVAGVGPVFSKGPIYVWKSGLTWKKLRMLAVCQYQTLATSQNIDTLLEN